MFNRIKKYFYKNNHLQFSGPYKDWQDATKNSTGYSSSAVLTKVENAIEKVLNGQSKYERDGTNFENLPIKNTLIEFLMDFDLQSKHSILDVGGGLGSLYINYKSFFESSNFEYIVLEQDNFYLKGKEIAKLHDLPIKFIKDLSTIKDVEIVILSSTLQYFENWKKFVKEILDKNPKHIFIDRHPLSDDVSKIFVQLNKNYYSEEVTYPLHICNEEEFIAEFIGYELISSWNSDFDPEYFKGFYFIKE